MSAQRYGARILEEVHEANLENVSAFELLSQYCYSTQLVYSHVWNQTRRLYPFRA